MRGPGMTEPHETSAGETGRREAMSAADVPEELVRAAAKAMSNRRSPETGLAFAPEGWWIDDARTALGAALPLHEQQLRQRAEAAERALEEMRGRIGEPEPERRFVLADGTVSDFELHNEASCGCRREMRDVWFGEWKAADGD